MSQQGQDPAGQDPAGQDPVEVHSGSLDRGDSYPRDLDAARPVSTAAFAAALRQRLAAFADDDPARLFTAIYLRTTEAVAQEISAGGFLDGEWVDRWDAAFGDLYLRPLDASRAGAPVAQPWAVAFDFWQRRRHLRPISHVLVGINAHINYDLPQALLAVIGDEEFDDVDLLARRNRDHSHVDDVLASRIAAEDELLAGLGMGLVDRLLRPLNRLATRRVLREARAKVWANTRLLAAARRQGPGAYDETLARLERLSAARVADLVRSGQVLLRLARIGFGVRLDASVPNPRNGPGAAPGSTSPGDG